MAAIPVDFRARRRSLIERMAADLVRYEAHAVESDSVLCLYGRGYDLKDVMPLIAEVRSVAFQAIVAREMADPC